jgi:hypothetical protein
MFSQSVDYSQTSNGDYSFFHNNSSQNTSQFEFDGIQNKNQNTLGAGDLCTINEENTLSPMKINYNNDSKKSLMLNQNLSKASKYSFSNLNNNHIGKNDVECANDKMAELNHSQKSINDNNDKENINNNINPNSNNDNNFIINFNSYKCQLSQQIDQFEKIASQQINNTDNHFNDNSKNNDNSDHKEMNNSNLNVNNSIPQDELLQHQNFNKYCSELIDNAMNRNIEYIDKMKNNFVNILDDYKIKFKSNAEIIKKLILLYSDDIFQKEKNKIIILHMTDQLLNQINSFFLEMDKFYNFSLNSSNSKQNENS